MKRRSNARDIGYCSESVNWMNESFDVESMDWILEGMVVLSRAVRMRSGTDVMVNWQEGVLECWNSHIR